MNLYALVPDPRTFEALVQRLLDADGRTSGSSLSGFQSVSADLRGDLGIDGFLPGGIVFQIYYALPEGSTPMLARERRKVSSTCRKIAQKRQVVEQVIGASLTGITFVLARDPDVDLLLYCSEAAAKLGELSIEVWGATRLANLLESHRQDVADLLPSGFRGPNIDALLDEAYHATVRGDMQRAVDLADRAFMEALLKGDPARQCRALLELSTQHVREGNWDALESTTRDAYDRAARLATDKELLAKAIRFRAEAKLRVGELEEAADLSLRALSCAQESGVSAVTASVRYQLAWIALARDDDATAQAYCDACKDWHLSQDKAGQGAWLELAAQVAFRGGDLDTAYSMMRDAVANFAEAGDRRAECLLRGRWAEMLAKAQHFTEALQITQGFRASSTSEALTPYVLALELLTAELLFRTDQADAGVVLCESVRERAEDAGHTSILGQASLRLGRAALARQIRREPLPYAEAAYRAFCAVASRRGQFEALKVRASSRSLDRDFEYVEDDLRQAAAIADQERLSDVIKAEALIPLAHAQAHAGRYADAVTTLERVAPGVVNDAPESARYIQDLNQYARSALQVQQRLATLMGTENPLAVAGTAAARTLPEAHATVLHPLLDWAAAWPDAGPGLLDFWGRGNFSRIALNHRGFPEAFHLMVEVGTVAEARHAVACLAPLADCLTLLWKGELSATVAMIPQHVDYEGPGGWGYMTCAGDECRPTDDSPWDWCPAIGLGNFVSEELAAFILRDAQAFTSSGRLVLAPAPLVGCVSRGHGYLERLLAGIMCADPVIRVRSGTSRRDTPLAIEVPYLPDAPLSDLALVSVDEQESLARMREVLVRVSFELASEGEDVASTQMTRYADELRDVGAEVQRRFGLVSRRLADHTSYGQRVTRLSLDVLSLGVSPTLRAATPAASALSCLAAASTGPGQPFYPFYGVNLGFGRSWRPVSATTPWAGPPNVADARPDAQRDARRYYHWLHPPDPGWVIPTVALPTDVDGK